MAETRKPTKGLIETVIKSKNLDELLMLEETDWFEFRDRHYATTSSGPSGSKAKYELAKDISSISNSGGGYIFIGLKPKVKETEMTEYVSAISGIKKKEINLESWRDSLASSLTPRFTLNKVDYGFIDIDSSKSVMWLRVPNATKLGLYPIVFSADQWRPDKNFTINGRVIGLYERDGAENIMPSIEKIQTYISQGIAQDKTGTPFSPDLARMASALEGLLSKSPSPNVSEAEHAKGLEGFLMDATRKVPLNEKGVFYMYSSPLKALEIPDFLAQHSDENSVAWLMKNPPILRPMGWSLSVGSQEYPSPEDNSWEIQNGNRKLLKITKEGRVGVLAALSRFLDWGLDEEVENNPDYDILINEYALSEFIAMYMTFLKKFITDIAKGATRAQFYIYFGFITPESKRVGLHQPLMPGLPSNGTAGPLKRTARWKLDRITPSDPYAIAGKIILEITRFGFGSTDQPPYFKIQDGALIFDEDSYKRS